VRTFPNIANRRPIPGSPLSPQYYANRSRSVDDLFVRAAVTYLRQDFSVVLPVAKAAPWPEEQRFDFLVRTRKATKAEAEGSQKQQGSYPQREAVLFALRQLQDLKSRAEPNRRG
jgi:hypothetical protein